MSLVEWTKQRLSQGFPVPLRCTRSRTPWLSAPLEMARRSAGPEFAQAPKEALKESETKNLNEKISILENSIYVEKDKKVKEYEKTIQDIQKFQEDKKAMFLKGSNLDDNLYK